MTFTAPLGLLALVAVPAVVALHLFRRRLRERRVAGLFLWSAERLLAEAGRRRTRLLQSWSLWLEAAAALVLALWLAGPSLGGAAARHVVVVLDDSASMAAVTRGRAAADRAREVLGTRVRELAAADRITVLKTGARPELLLGPAARVAEFEPELLPWRPSQPAHDPLPALDLARELAGGRGEVWFCTDRPLPAAGRAVAVFACGVPAGNAAIVAASRSTAADGGEQLRVTVAGFVGLREAVLTAHEIGPERADGRELRRAAVDLGNGPATVRLDLPPGTGDVHVALGADALAADDEAWLLRALPRTVAVCDLLPAETRAALELERALQALSGWRAEVDPRHAQLVIAAAPGRLGPGQIEIVVGPSGGERDAFAGPFVLDRAHPFLQGIQLEGVVWVAGRESLPGRVLIAAGRKALCSEDDAGAGSRLWLDLDPGAGNVPRAPDWPILLANVLEAARAEVAGPEQQEVLLGQEARYRRSLVAGAADARLELVAPDGSRAEGRGLRTLAWLPQQPGRHSVRGAGDQEVGAFAVRFVDPSESDLAGAATGTFPAAEAAPASDRGLRDGESERRWLALALLLFVLADWFVLSRRGA